MKRTVKSVIQDLKKESEFQARIGMVPVANLLMEAVYYLQRPEKVKEELNAKTDNG